MNQLVKPTARMARGLSRDNAARLRIFKRGAGRELNDSELDEAIEWCELYNANPMTKDIYFFVFDKNKPDRRRMVPVLSISKYRQIADATGTYRPDEAPPRYTYDQGLKSDANPRGIVDCEVTVWKHAHGQWHPVTSKLRWDERAPIITRYWDKAKGGWADCKPRLDPKKDNWGTMPETMLAKCVEADALRKGWPAETAGSYGDGELDRSDVIDLTATEVLAEHEQSQRQIKTGTGIVIDWCDGEPLEQVAYGQVADRVLAFVRERIGMDDADRVSLFASRNREPLRQFWAHAPGDALAVKQAIARAAEIEATA